MFIWEFHFSNKIVQGIVKRVKYFSNLRIGEPFIKYACCKGQSFSKNVLYGLSDFSKQESNIKNAVNELKEMREGIGLLRKVQDKPLLGGFRLTCSHDEDSSMAQCSFFSSGGTECEWITGDYKIVNSVKVMPC